MNLKITLNKVLPHLIAVIAMFVVSSVYFYPALEGKSLQGEDVIGSYGQHREAKDFRLYENKETVIWNGAIFSGMPDYINAPYKGADNLKQIFYTPGKFGIPREITAVFWYMIGFYILMTVMGVTPRIAVGGSIAYSLTSYYIIIILAGHYMKIYTLALIPPVLAGIILCFNRKYLWGFIITAFFTTMMITMAHIQMIYYFLIALIIIGAVELIHNIKEKTILQFTKTMAVVIAAALLAFASNYSRLINYYKYNELSIRGNSELMMGREDSQIKNGLDKDYINSWSSGVDESMMVIVPDVKGGMTGAINQDSNLLNKLPSQYRNTFGGFNQYWGNQPFSGGPNYLGVVFVLLFLIGVFTLKQRLKFQLLLPVVLFFFLAMGGSFSAFTDLFIYYVPMYNKFRAPVSILAVASILLCFMAVYTIYNIIKSGEILDKKTTLHIFKKPKPVYILVSGGMLIFLMINILFPNLFNTYISYSEQNQFNALKEQPDVISQLNTIIRVLVDFRISVFRADLWRAVLFIVLVTAALFFYSKKKISQTVLSFAIIILAIIDFWGVSRRYVSLNSFKKEDLVQDVYQLTNADRQIYQMQLNSVSGLSEKYDEAEKKFNPSDDDEKQQLETYIINKYSHYRVFNTISSPFQENVTTNAHRSIGGYHAVKLRRYQDLIEQHISKMNPNVLNMLNTKYIITENGPQINSEALGAAWFADSVKWVNSADEEILALNEVNVKTTSIIRSEAKNMFPLFSSNPVDSSASIVLTNYAPDNLTYTISTPENKIVVFSEIYYPDWKVFIDGKESELYSANYVLRALVVPKGEHKIEFVFHPKLFYNSQKISQISFFVLVAVLVVTIGCGICQRKTNSSIIKADD
ncbi:MAG: YfhO family protein [Bacteroidales bacterium]|jgi:hypothetical protein|nr:YfhO family protein [Bacteroidales bacterium]